VSRARVRLLAAKEASHGSARRYGTC
jgi:hypothetical protein